MDPRLHHSGPFSVLYQDPVAANWLMNEPIRSKPLAIVFRAASAAPGLCGRYDIQIWVGQSTPSS
jgi:hypothetical protein